MAKRFLLCPGYVRSVSDGQEHYIHGAKLADLYGLNPEECVIRSDSPHFPGDDMAIRSLIPLHPLRDGKYKEHLKQIKIGDFQKYLKAKKLLSYHESGASPRRADMRKILAEQQRKSIAWHESHWPDFPAAYERYMA